jgi:hypothetical protein
MICGKFETYGGITITLSRIGNWASTLKSGNYI